MTTSAAVCVLVRVNNGVCACITERNTFSHFITNIGIYSLSSVKNDLLYDRNIIYFTYGCNLTREYTRFVLCFAVVI